MNSNSKYWHIKEFTKELAKRFSEFTGNEETAHFNTITNWFNAMEDKGIHYVQKIDDVRAFDELDMEIALYIIEHRKQKWQLDAIYNVLQKKFDLRPSNQEVKSENDIPSGFDESRFVQLFNAKFSEIGSNMDASAIILNRQQQLNLEINHLENNYLTIESEMRNIERSKRYVELLDLKEEVAPATINKNKGFFARLFGSAEGSDVTVKKDKVLAPAAKEELDALNTEYQDLDRKKKEMKLTLDSKRGEFETLNKTLRNRHSVTLEEAKEILSLEYKKLDVKKESVVHESP